MVLTPLVTIAVLTVSDRCYKKETEDKSGPLLKEMLQKDFQLAHILHTCVPDEIEEIKEKLVYWADETRVDLIITSGGTGMSPRDVTPEATLQLIDRQTPSIEHLVQSEALKITPLAMLSRTTCGIRKKCLIMNFPGSAKAVRENYSFIRPYLPTIVAKLKNPSIPSQSVIR